MVIFKQAMTKYLRAPSTWIILILSFFISGFLAGYLPFDASLKQATTAHYGYSVLMSTGVMTTMVSMFSAIFAGFKGASMFRDEIESGTFLVLLSKPISRTKIIMQKWLALQVIMLLYAVSNIIIYEIVVVCCDSFNNVKYVSGYGTPSISENIFTVCGYMFLVLFTMGLIFSSIAMILSTKLSTSTTIGISIGIGVIIPITGMIGAFTQKQEFTQLDNQLSHHYMSNLEELSDVSKNIDSEGLDTIRGEVKEAFDFAKDPKQGFYKIGLKTAEEDRFDTYFGLDLNYQLELLGALSTKDIITNEYKQSLTTMGVMSQLAPIVKVNKDKGFDYSKWSTATGAESDVFNKLVEESAMFEKVGEELAEWLVKNGFMTVTGDVDPNQEQVWPQTDESNNPAANTINLAHDMIFAPVFLFLDEKGLAEAQKDTWNTPVDADYTFIEFQRALSAKTGVAALGNIQKEEDTYTYLMNIIANDRQNLIYIKLGDYVPKLTLLWCYLAFAIGLVPISLLIMRKKDFR